MGEVRKAKGGVGRREGDEGTTHHKQETSLQGQDGKIPPAHFFTFPRQTRCSVGESLDWSVCCVVGEETLLL